MQAIQVRLVGSECQLQKPYNRGPYNKVKGKKQAIRLTEGCVHNCPNCHEGTEIKLFDLPTLEKTEILIFDMNLLCKPQALQIIKDLGDLTVNGKHVGMNLFVVQTTVL
jgi:hypothetical protein